MEKLSQDQIDAQLGKFPGWSQANDKIQRTCVFETFSDSLTFVNRVAELAEAQQHHPDILVRYNKVTLTLSTHDAGGITDKDFHLAAAIDDLVPVPAE